MGKERERLSKLRLAIAGYQGDIISPEEEDDSAHQERFIKKKTNNI